LEAPLPEDTADVVATAGSDFTLTISSGRINSATIETDQASKSLTVAAGGRAVEVTNLPAGDSFVSMAMIWSPGDTDATVDVENGGAQIVDPKPVIDLGDNPGTVDLFGKAS
jgi:hypothetical protein